MQMRTSCTRSTLTKRKKDPFGRLHSKSLASRPFARTSRCTHHRARRREHLMKHVSGQPARLRILPTWMVGNKQRRFLGSKVVTSTVCKRWPFRYTSADTPPLLQHPPIRLERNLTEYNHHL